MINFNNYRRVRFDEDSDMLDTFNVDNNLIPNGVLIAFQRNEKFKQQNSSTYYNLIVNRPELQNSNYVNVLIVEAQQGHQIFNYDKCYNYYIGTVVNLDGGKSELIKQDITKTISEDEAKYIHRCIWNHREVLPTLKLQCENALKEYDCQDEFVLFSHCIMGNNYQATWISSKYKGCILITVEDYKSGNSVIMINDSMLKILKVS